MASRPGGGRRKKVGCAVGRSILIIVWHLLNDPAARYRDLGADWHARHTAAARPAASSRPSATTSSSPSGRTSPDLAAPLTAYRRQARGHASPRGHFAVCKNRGHDRRLRWLFLGQTISARCMGCNRLLTLVLPVVLGPVLGKGNVVPHSRHELGFGPDS